MLPRLPSDDEKRGKRASVASKSMTRKPTADVIAMTKMTTTIISPSVRCIFVRTAAA